MNLEISTIRFLGATQLFVFVASMLSERLLASVVGSGSISEILVNSSKNLTRLRISNLFALLTCVGIVILGVLFYIVFYKEYRIFELVALGFFLVETKTLALSKIGIYALIPLSQEFVEGESPEPSYYHTLGGVLYHGVDRTSYELHMLFFCLGGILWYYLLYISNDIPRTLAIWGLIAVSLLLISMFLQLYDREYLPAAGILTLPYVPFELVLGIWLIVKGFNKSATIIEYAKKILRFLSTLKG